MRRILRWAFHILAACSLLLCVASGIAWAWSYRSPIVVQRIAWGPPAAGRSRIHCDEAMAGRGALGLFCMRFSPYRDGDDAALTEIDLILRDRAESMRTGPAVDPATEYGFIPPDLPRRLGFRWGSAEWPVYRVRCVAQGVIVPMRSVTALLAILPAAWLLLALRRRRRRVKHGHCAACGYDLRATPVEGGPLLTRCPECGREADGAAVR